MSCIALHSTVQAIEWVNGLNGTFSSSIEETDNPDIIRRSFETPHHKMTIDLPGENAPLTFSNGHFYVRADDPDTGAIILVNIFQAKNKLGYTEVRRLLVDTFGGVTEEHKGSNVNDTYFFAKEVDEYGNQFHYKWFIAHNYLFSVVVAAVGPDYDAQISCWSNCLNSVVWKKS